MNRKITEKQFYIFKLRLASPLSISSGLSDNTDSDILKNGNGEVFIPGTSLAGVFRDALDLPEKESNIMGFSDGEDGRMSSVCISDLYFDKKPVISARDGVSLNSDKTVDNKFDMEIIETGATGTLYISCTVREDEKASDYTDAMKKIAAMIEDGSVRIGGNKNRGFGRIEFQEMPVAEKDADADRDTEKYMLYQVFTKNDKDQYIEFIKDSRKENLYAAVPVSDWINGIDDPAKYIKISVPLKLTGGISIRKYSAKPQEADYEQITCNGKPVIPGSSWNGAIRADIRSIFKELGCKNTEKILAQWFGYTAESRKKTLPLDKDEPEAQQSLIVIGESIVQDAVRMPMTRNKINRFSAATIDAALYKEVSYFGGTTKLEILVRKDESKGYKALVGMLQLVIEDIVNGYMPVGGLVSIGRGIFESNGEATYSEECENPLAELYALIDC